MSENKRKHSGKQNGPRKRYKSDGTRIGTTTIHGPGVFVTCVKGKERLAGKEIRDVFESIASDLWPISNAQVGEQTGVELNGSDDEEDEDEDLEARIIRDRARVQSEQNVKGGESATGAWAENEKARKRIVIHYTDTPCLLFASCAAPIDPVALTLAYLDEVKEKGIARTRAVQRLEPIANTCVASMPELLLLGEKVFKDGFKTRAGSESEGYTYKVVAKVRNNAKLSSLKLIEELPRIVPSGHSVSLKQPDLTILVIVFKSIAGIGVAPRYEELRRYNVAQLVEARDLDEELGETSRLKKPTEDEAPAGLV